MPQNTYTLFDKLYFCNWGTRDDHLVNINSCGVPFEEIEDYIRKCTNINEMNHPIIPLPPPNINENAARVKYIDIYIYIFET